MLLLASVFGAALASVHVPAESPAQARLPESMRALATAADVKLAKAMNKGKAMTNSHNLRTFLGTTLAGSLLYDQGL